MPVLLGIVLLGCSTPDSSLPPSDEPAILPGAESMETPEITLNGPGQLLPVTATTELNGERFELEVATTPQEQSLGLMFRSELPDNRGMLFPFAAPRRTRFWMKDVPVPLDMVFVRDGAVVGIEAEVPPCPAEPCPTYGPGNQLVDQVIELRSGRAAEIGLKQGDAAIVMPLP